jgi:hypothetical protein
MNHTPTQRGMKQTFILFASLIFLGHLLALSISQSTVYASNGMRNIISGSVLKKEDRTLTLKNGTLLTEVHIPTEANISKNAMSNSLSNIQVNDYVSLSQNESGEITTVEAVSGELVQLSRWIVPLLSGSIAAVVLATVLTRKIRTIIEKEAATEYAQSMEIGMTS